MISSKADEFLTPDNQERIVDAIREAESQTSGEIRVHLEAVCTGNTYLRAQEIFHLLKMDNTKQENAILIYLAFSSRKFAVIGDRGIHLKVHDGFWQQVKNVMEVRFRESEFTTGIVDGIHMVGKQLSQYFPWDVNDVNELSDAITTS